MKKICIVTGSRAEYGIMHNLLKAIAQDTDFKLQIIATCMHLSPEFGLTYQEIEADGFSIDYKVEILLSADTPTAISKSIGLGLIGFADAFAQLKPDMLLVLGDRFEILAAAIAAMNARIPIAHIHGGESTIGAVDEAIRHAITKMSSLHFTATAEYRKRVVQLGEDPNRVFNVGSLGVENSKLMRLLKKDELEATLLIKFQQRNLLVTFHPVTLENLTAQSQFKELLTALSQISKTLVIFTKANADENGRIINQMIDAFVKNHLDNAVAFTSLGTLRYFSLLQFVDGMVGNSSSGIIEAPSFKIGTINIGDRQQGRVKPSSIIDCQPNARMIKESIETLYSSQYQNKLITVNNPYEGKNTILAIINKLKKPFSKITLKKTFYDLEVTV